MSELDAKLDVIAPSLKKWAAVILVETGADGQLSFTRHEYRGSGSATDFWPASAIKLYPAIALLELLNERKLPFDTTVAFERKTAGKWILDCARTVKEMLSEVFRRSSNEDYTLLLRAVGLTRLNEHFLTPARGFAHSALMRGYVTMRPYRFERDEPQRITFFAAGQAPQTVENTWNGVSYAEVRGATVLDPKTANLTTPNELAECMRRVCFHEKIPPKERFLLTDEQAAFLRHGGDGFCGLETKAPESYPSAWSNGVEKVFPNARFYHKCGIISNFALEVALVDDTKDSGKHFILVPVINAGLATKPDDGEKLIGQMAKAIAEWVRGT